MANARRLYSLGDGLYHVIVRTVAGLPILDEQEKKILYSMIIRMAEFGGIRIITYCILDNHLHLIVRVPLREVVSDDEFERRVCWLYGNKKAQILFESWKMLEEKGQHRRVREEKEKLIRRMYNLSDFVKSWKEDFTQSYNRRHDQDNQFQNGKNPKKRRIGTVWAGRFKSILLNGKPNLTLIVALYVDLNPVRAHIHGVERDAGNYAWSGIGSALNGGKRAMEGILELARWAGFAKDTCTAERAVELYHAILLGKAGGKIKNLLDSPFEIRQGDRRFDKSLRGQTLTLFELLFCKCRCFENGRALS